MVRVLVIGANSAIAKVVARLYQARGARLYLLGRDAQKLAEGAQALGAVGYEAGDFTEIEANEGRVTRAISALGGLDLALVAHGWLGDQAAAEHDLAHAEALIRANYTSVVSLLIPIANHLEQQRSGHLAVLSSTAAERGRPQHYTYGSAKGAVNVYLQGLRSRLRGAGVRVHTFKLGPVDTPMTANLHKHRLYATPEGVAAAIVAAIDANVDEAYVPWYWGPIMGLVKNIPESLFQRVKFLARRHD